MVGKFFTYFFIIFFFYFIIGGIIFNHLFPSKKPNYLNYFKTKTEFSSKGEGLTNEVKKVENNLAYLKVTIKPMAEGPPEHIHNTFDEFFTVEKGTLSLKINGQIKKLKSCESIKIPKGTAHKPFNETGEIVILNDSTNSSSTMPCEFAYGLAQLYPVMDKYGEKSPKVLLKLAALGNDFDTWAPDAPIPAQKLIRWLLGPSARLLN
jgi:mannose-6-phosphate isomerase-like protein (cupin superfamily)